MDELENIIKEFTQINTIVKYILWVVAIPYSAYLIIHTIAIDIWWAVYKFLFRLNVTFEE